jgi:hypothetical protein
MPAEVASGIVSYGPQLLQLVSAGVPIALLMKWGSYRERSWKFSQRKTRALRKLIEKDEWRDAPALHVQYAFQDAFGRSFDRAELAFIEGRQRPLALIKDRLAGGAFLKFKEDDSGYERNASASMQKLSLKFWSRLCSSWVPLFRRGSGGSCSPPLIPRCLVPQPGSFVMPSTPRCVFLIQRTTWRRGLLPRR